MRLLEKMARPNRRHFSQLPLRFLPEQRERVEAAARHRGKTMSDMIRDAVMEYVSVVEEEVRLAKQREREASERAFMPKGPRPRGWGFKPPREEPPPLQAAPPPPTVIVHTGGGSTAGGDLVDGLARYVREAGDAFERERRSSSVTAILQASVSDDMERARLAKALDDKLAATPEPKRSGWSWLSGLAGLTSK